MVSNPIPKVDENNKIIGITTITEARKNGWPRRVTRIFISNEKGEFLLQKRSAEAKIHPCVWDCSGGHVDEGETYAEAGAREVYEELGVTIEVQKVSKPVFFQNTFYVACVGSLEKDVSLTLKLDEVTEVKWISTDELLQMITFHPESFTPWLVDAWINLKDNLIQ